MWIETAHLNPGAFLFPSRIRVSPHVSTREDGTHRPPLGGPDRTGRRRARHTFDAPYEASLIYRRIKNLRAVQLLLGHAKLESTVRYPGIEVGNALEMAEQSEV